MTDAGASTTVGSAGTPSLPREAFARGVVGIPLGLALGGLIGYLGADGSPERSASEATTVLAIVFGFFVAPSVLSSVRVARRAEADGRHPVRGLLRTMFMAAAAGLAWGAFGGLVAYGFGLATTTEFPLAGSLIFGAGVGVVLAAMFGLAIGSVRAIRAARSDSALP